MKSGTRKLLVYTGGILLLAVGVWVATPNYLEPGTRSPITRVQSDMRAFATALESYYIDYGEYPVDIRDLSPKFIASSAPIHFTIEDKVYPLQYHVHNPKSHWLLWIDYPSDDLGDTIRSAQPDDYQSFSYHPEKGHGVILRSKQ